MVGSGSSLVYTPSVVILGHYFKRYHGVVNGFVTIGSALFGVVLPHVFKLLFQEVGVSTKNFKNLFRNLIGNVVQLHFSAVFAHHFNMISDIKYISSSCLS